MGKRDKKVDHYIAASASFAQPILNHLRDLVHQACPEVEETIKWGFPNFVYGGILCNMAAFQHHCSFGFWKAALMTDSRRLFSKEPKTGMGNLGQVRALSDLPPDKIILSYLDEAIRLNEAGTPVPERSKSRPPKPLDIPPYFVNALKKNKKAFETFETFSVSNKREYVDWVTEAKTDETRSKRIATSIEWLSQGKIRNWKYASKA